jgi:hypothetical protein
MSRQFLDAAATASAVLGVAGWLYLLAAPSARLTAAVLLGAGAGLIGAVMAVAMVWAIGVLAGKEKS